VLVVSVVLVVIVLVLSCRRPQFSPHGVENVSDVTCRSVKRYSFPVVHPVAPDALTMG
jgi:hypothetical protein